MTHRVGLMGPVNNSAYGIASGLADAGTPVSFVRSRHTRLPIDQPVWQDAEFDLDTTTFRESGTWSWERWSRFEADVGWRAPAWSRDPATQRPTGAYRPAAGTPPALRAALAAAGRRRDWAAVQDCWADADVLVVSGSTPTLLASGAGRPYLVWPHGSDARTAGRRFVTGVHGARARAAAEGQAWLLRQAYRSAAALVTHDPLLVTGDHGLSARLGELGPVRFVGWPVEVQRRAPRAERRQRLAELLDRLGVAPVDADVVALVASRIDYATKGHDRLIAALAELGDRGTHYVMIGWGADVDRARAALAQAGLGERVTLLTRVMSKPVIRSLYASVDVSVDQFVYGTYGTAALESMAVGTPVVMALDEPAFAARDWEPPPVLAARTVPELVRVLSGVAGGGADLERAGALAADWVERRHSPAAVQAQLARVVAELGLVR